MVLDVHDGAFYKDEVHGWVSRRHPRRGKLQQFVHERRQIVVGLAITVHRRREGGSRPTFGSVYRMVAEARENLPGTLIQH